MSSPASGTAQVPLCVDLDGTLLRTNSLHEAAWELICLRPECVAMLAPWLARGQAHLWQQLIERVSVDVTTLPYRPEIIALVAQAGREGREVVLVTGAHRSVAEHVAGHIGGFTRVLGSDAQTHLVGVRKRDALVAAYGSKGFDYVADSATDFAVWSHSRRALLAGGSRGVAKRLEAEHSDVELVHAAAGRQSSVLLRLFAPHRRAAELMVLLPLLPGRWEAGIQPLVALCLAASSAAVLESLAHRASDRRDPHLSGQPFATGEISPLAGVALTCFLLVAACLALWGQAASTVVAEGAYAVLCFAMALNRPHGWVRALAMVGQAGLRLITGFTVR